MILPAKITAEHLTRRALIYVRQSTPEQLDLHPESTARQYALRDRASDLGWPMELVEVIDSDLGKSGASADGREGFQRLVSEVGLGRIGLVLSIETSRLARSGRDWYHLLELCALSQTLIADEDGIYDPAIYNDRLLLGLKGTMSEAELHLLRQRLVGGALQKASRGDLKIPLPTGYIWAAGDEGKPQIVLDPDEGVQAAIHQVFRLFNRLGSAAQVHRALVREGAELPRRLRVGPAKGQVVWTRPGDWMILQILRDPIYARAYAYGRQRRDPRRVRPGHPASGTVRLPMQEWKVLLRDHHVGYVEWAAYETNLGRLQANRASYEQGQKGPVRRGPALLQGLARCGLCGSLMRLNYTGPENDHPVYSCKRRYKLFAEPTCQEVRARAVDPAVARALLAAVQPEPLEAALRTLEVAEREVEARREAWRLRIERTRYAAERAWRQYDAVEPENRLVARELERRWNERLRELSTLEAAQDQEERSGRLEISEAEREQIRCLADHLPAVWADPRTRPEDKKRLLRCLIDEVTLTTDKQTDRITIEITWRSGVQSKVVVSRPVHAYSALGRYPDLVSRIRSLAAEGCTDEEIARRLEAEGWRPARTRCFGAKSIWIMRHENGIEAGSLHLPAAPPEKRAFTPRELARELDLFLGTVYHWLSEGRLVSVQRRPGMQHQIELTEAELERLRAHVQRQHQRIRKPSSHSTKGAA